MASPFSDCMRKRPFASVSNPTGSWAIIYNRFAVSPTDTACSLFSPRNAPGNRFAPLLGNDQVAPRSNIKR